MAPVDHETGGRDHALLGRHAQPAREVDAGDHLALVEIVEDHFALGGRDPVGEATTGSTPIKAEDQARTLRRTPIAVGVDAKTAVMPVNFSEPHLQMREARMPHE